MAETGLSQHHVERALRMRRNVQLHLEGLCGPSLSGMAGVSDRFSDDPVDVQNENLIAQEEDAYAMRIAEASFLRRCLMCPPPPSEGVRNGSLGFSAGTLNPGYWTPVLWIPEP